MIKVFKKITEKYNFNLNKYKELSSSLKKDGFIKIENFYKKNDIEKIQKKFDHLFKNNFEKFNFEIHPTIKKNNVEINSKNIQNSTNYTNLKNPLINIPEIFNLINDDIIEILYSFFGVMPKMTGINLRRSFANNLNESGTTLFHCDENSYKFLKVFIYLKDVDENSGPFTFIETSQTVKFPFYQKKYHYTSDEIFQKYSKRLEKKIIGKVGDIIIANTRGFHKGSKVNKHYRDLLTIHFGIHKEYFKSKNYVHYNKNIINDKKYNILIN